MKSSTSGVKSSRSSRAGWTLRLRLFVAAAAAFLLASCGTSGTPKSEPFIAQTSPPPKQEFRWTNGRTPKNFDPALAAAPPETDIVRALFEGLTDIDARTLEEIPGVAERWTASEDLKTWTFYLREDARWSNGAPVTADDFVRSWARLAKLGPQVPFRDLLHNIVGIHELHALSAELKNSTQGDAPAGVVTAPVPAASPSTAIPSAVPTPSTPQVPQSTTPSRSAMIPGIVADGPRVLRVSLVLPDPDFAKLVASPIFRPTFGEAAQAAGGVLSAAIVTNGAFRIASVGPDGVALARSETYWDRQSVELERVRFVPKDGAEKALEAYRNGEVDAVTNADFEPLALKLLTPFDDFRQTTHSAVNFYAVNFKKAPFSDRRVRQALAMAIDREQLTEGELKGSTRPALSFLPFAEATSVKLSQDRDAARQLLEDAGFPDGLNFPVVRLVVNRNDVQQRIARLVARMWKRNLNIDTEIIVKTLTEVDEAAAGGDFDLIRRGVVLPSNDEAMSLLSIFGTGGAESETPDPAAAEKTASAVKGLADSGNANRSATATERSQTDEIPAAGAILTEEAAITELRAIPLYFPTSYSLVKPYVIGFEINGLDAPSLKDVSIDSSWQPK